MSLSVRIIPRLDIKGPNLVKGIHLEGLRVLGDPEVFAKFYDEQGADELFYMDVVASLYGRNSLKDMISKTAQNVFIPITVGGGLRSIEDIREVLKAGADKVCLNTAAIQNPDLIKQASQRFGSSTIVIAIEAIRQPDGRYLAFTDNGREHTGIEAVEWARKVESLGAGELVITSVDREGTGTGYDLNLIQAVSAAVSIPVIAHGGASDPQNVADAVKKGGASAVAMASILHYDAITRAEFSKNERTEGNTSFLGSGRSFGKIKPTDLKKIRATMRENGIPCRDWE